MMSIFLKMFLFLILWCGMVSADVFVVYDEATKNVYSISDRSDAVVPSGHAVVTLPGKAEDYPDAQNYQYAGKRLKLNTARLKEKNEEADKAAQRMKELDAVQKRALKQAYDQLKAEGYVFESLTDSEFGGQ